jgi:hypothetical protein
MSATLLAAKLCLLLSTAAAPAATAPPAPSAPAAAAERLLDATAAWRAARWGMTVDEVLKAFPGQARPLQPEQRLADGKVIAAGIDRVEVGGVACRVHFLFEGGRLALVSLKSLPVKAAQGSDYEALKARLAAETGQAGEERPLDATVDYREVRFSAGVSAVDVKFLQGALVLLYHPAGG